LLIALVACFVWKFGSGIAQGKKNGALMRADNAGEGGMVLSKKEAQPSLVEPHNFRVVNHLFLRPVILSVMYHSCLKIGWAL